jgi:hypothetical protein
MQFALSGCFEGQLGEGRQLFLGRVVDEIGALHASMSEERKTRVQSNVFQRTCLDSSLLTLSVIGLAESLGANKEGKQASNEKWVGS